MMSFEKPGGGARGVEKKEKPEGCTTIFIGNLSWSIDEVKTRDFFCYLGKLGLTPCDGRILRVIGFSSPNFPEVFFSVMSLLFF